MELNPSKKLKKISGKEYTKRYQLLSLIFLRNNIFISLCSVFFFISGSLLINPNYPGILSSSLIFWSTLLIYQINTKIKFNFLSLKSYKKLDFKSNKSLKFVLIIALILLFHIPFMNFKSIICLSFLGLISTLYNVPEKSNINSLLPLRSVPILKVFLIAFVWAFMSSFLPAISESPDIYTLKNTQVFIGHLFFITAITLPFDIRDLKKDNHSLIITIPQLIGVRFTKIFAIILLMLFYLVMIPFLNPIYLFIFILITMGLILFSSTKKQDYYYTLFIDGTIILYFFTVILSLE